MVISDDKTFRDIQRDFNSKFSYLKLEFYSSQHGEGEGSPVQERLDPEQLLKNVRQKHTEGSVQVKKNMRVCDFEKMFHDKFGLNVQVFRKSGNLWMQTTSTDHWTLAEQNRKGGSSELHYKEKYRT